jgi:hypothetical protein
MKRHNWEDGQCVCGQDYNRNMKEVTPCGPLPFTDVLQRPSERIPGKIYQYWLCKKCGKRVEVDPDKLPHDQQLRIYCDPCGHFDNYWQRNLKQ